MSRPEPSGGLPVPHNGIRKADGRNGNGRNRRSVWTLTGEPYAGAHYATFPRALVTPCVLAGTSARGVCSVCGAPWLRVVASNGHKNGRKPAHTPGRPGHTKTSSTHWKPVTQATDHWRPSCVCGPGEPVPAVVLDPFCGSGTTGQVARLHGRRFVGLDISLVYLRDQALARAEGLTPESALRELPMFAEAAP